MEIMSSVKVVSGQGIHITSNSGRMSAFKLPWHTNCSVYYSALKKERENFARGIHSVWCVLVYMYSHKCRSVDFCSPNDCRFTACSHKPHLTPPPPPPSVWPTLRRQSCQPASGLRSSATSCAMCPAPPTQRQ